MVMNFLVTEVRGRGSGGAAGVLGRRRWQAAAPAAAGQRETATVCHFMQGYVDAARVFERESGTAPGVDLDQAGVLPVPAPAATCAISPLHHPTELLLFKLIMRCAAAHVPTAAQITDRMEIRKAVQSGDVEQVGGVQGGTLASILTGMSVRQSALPTATLNAHHQQHHARGALCA